MIDEIILEKRLLYDSSIRTNKPYIYVMTDLEACYNRQLVNIGGIVEEAVGVNRNMIRTITKALLILKYYICTGFGISAQSYRSKEDPIGGSRQGNIFAGNMCCDKSGFILHKVQ